MYCRRPPYTVRLGEHTAASSTTEMGIVLQERGVLLRGRVRGQGKEAIRARPCGPGYWGHG